MLSSNGVVLPQAARYVGWLSPCDPTHLQDQAASQKLNEEGYVFLKGLLPRDLVLDVRERYFERLDRSFFKDGDTRRGVFSGSVPPQNKPFGVKGHPAYNFVRSPAFHAFADHPTLARAAEMLMGSPVERIRRTPFRHFIPGTSKASRAHADGAYISNDGADVLTFWVPLGDCPVEAGGLVYLEGSHNLPEFDETARQDAPNDRPDDRRPVTHDLKWVADRTGRRWLIADYEAGDVVVHLASIIHASLDPVCDVMRLSTDIRFVRKGVACDPRWRNDWAADDGY